MKNFLQIIIGFLVAFYVGLWLLSPYFLYLDDVRCGMHIIVGQDCTPRFKP
jgi:hypothetical protein